MELGATGTHPWSDYREQQIIQTEHYRRVEDGLKYVAWRNNTFSLHVHVGIRGADRAVLVCDRLRPVLPVLLAISANSPFLDGRDSGPAQRPHPDLHQELSPLRRARRRTAAGTRSPTTSTCSSRTRSIVEYTQVWWSIRPHLSFGTVEVRICDAQPTAAESDGLAALIVACVAQAARDIDEGVPFDGPAQPPDRGERVAGAALRARRRPARPERLEPYPAAAALERLLEWTAPVRAELGIDVALPALNGAQRQRRMLETGMSLHEIYAAVQAETRDDLFWGAGNSAEVTA